MSECRACGVCCDLYGHTLTAAEGDLARWRAEGAGEILAWVGQDGALWVDPGTGERTEGCPFLRRGTDGDAVCGIHAAKPQMCRDYPTRAHRYRCVLGVGFEGG